MVLPGGALIKIDVKDLFMRGRIAELCSVEESDSRDRFLGNRMKLIIGDRFVYTEGETEGTTQRELRGSGMGFFVSGEVSDYVFSKFVEERFLLCPNHRKHFLIRYYFNLKGDLLLVVGGDYFRKQALINLVQKNAICSNSKPKTSVSTMRSF